MIPPAVWQMAALRLAFAVIMLIGAGAMLKFAKVETALRINALMGLIGPVVLLAVTLLGVADLASRVSPLKLALVLAGTVLVFLGTR